MIECTMILDAGEWPYTNPNRCGGEAVKKLVHTAGTDSNFDEEDVAWTCEKHTPASEDGYWDTITDVED